jgi:hypothetical protein
MPSVIQLETCYCSALSQYTKQFCQLFCMGVVCYCDEKTEMTSFEAFTGTGCNEVMASVPDD